jgi:probable rRNA maturation factor
VEERRWKARRGLVAQIRRAAARALERGKSRTRKSCGLTILLSDDKKLRTLNRQYRRKNKTTNVLSFPAAPNRDSYLGDVAIALGAAEKEAGQTARRLADHAAHLAVHGVLHLLGYDHERTQEARKMERLEAKILAEFGISDPYELPPNPA